MKIDIPTILVVLAMTCAVVGSAFLISWIRRDRSGLALRAGIAGLLTAFAICLALTRPVAPGWLSIYVANGLMVLAFGIGWSAVRRYGDRSVPLTVIVAGAAIWFAVAAIPSVYENTSARVMIVTVILAAYSLACGIEFWRDPPAGTRSGTQTMLASLFAIHAGFVLIRGVHFAFIAPEPSLFDAGTVQALLTIEPLLALVAASLLGVGLVRERGERELRHSAETDGLTGILNRRAFFSRAEGLTDGTRNAGRPAALLVFDLDHFKAVNDRFGHLAGDRLLQTFTRVVVRNVRVDDLVGRIGGEEFAVLLLGVSHERASHIAERVRIDFAAEPIVWDGGIVTTTVSAGVAVGADVTVLTLFARADEALYDAKRNGRDRVHSSLPLLAAS